MHIYIINLILIISLYLILFKTDKIKNPKKTFCILIFIIFSLIQGLRSFNIGNDTSNYVKFFEISKGMSVTDIIFMKQWSIEPGYGLLMKICASINFTPQMFLLVVAIIINGGLMYFIYRYSDNPLISVIIFMGVEFFTLSFTALRQMIAVIILLNSYKYIEKENLIKFVFMVILATTFHKTAIIFLLIYLFRNIKINLKTVFIGIGIFFVTHLIAIPILSFITEKIFTQAYLINQEGGGIIQALVILSYLLLGFFIYKDLIIREEGTKNIMIIFMYISFLIQTLACRINMVNRLMWYFYIFIIIYLPNMKKDISTNRSLKIKNKEIKVSIIYSWMIIGLSLAQYVFFSIDMYNVVPYKILNI